MNPLYEDLRFPDPPQERPIIFMNMVSTIDGKTVSATSHDPINLGSKLDYATMRALEHKADAVMIGAGTLRSTPRLNYPPEQMRIVVSGSADLDFGVRFFTDAPDRAYVASDAPLPQGIGRMPSDLRELCRTLRQDHAVRVLLCEGGSELNASMIHLGLVDELFLTIAPKLKLGRGLPTYAGGAPLNEDQILNFDLVESRVVGDEAFLRYRVRREAENDA